MQDCTMEMRHPAIVSVRPFFFCPPNTHACTYTPMHKGLSGTGLECRRKASAIVVVVENCTASFKKKKVEKYVTGFLDGEYTAHKMEAEEREPRIARARVSVLATCVRSRARVHDRAMALQRLSPVMWIHNPIQRKNFVGRLQLRNHST